MQPALLMPILPNLLSRHIHHARILHCRGDVDLLIELVMDRVFQQLAQDSPQSLARARLGDHALAPNHPAQRGDGANLGADKLLDFLEQLLIGLGVTTASVRGADEGEGELTLEGVGDANYACFGDEGVAGDCLLERA